MNTSYSIPETAKLTGIPEHAIREYAKQFADVLPVPEANSDGGRSPVKRYPDAALEIFRSIRKLKDEGLDTAEIRTALYAQIPPPTADYVMEMEYTPVESFEEASADPTMEAMASWSEEAMDVQTEESCDTALSAETEATGEQTWTGPTEFAGEETMTGVIEAAPESDAIPEIQAGAAAEWSADGTAEVSEEAPVTEIEATATECGEATETIEETVTADSVIAESVTTTSEATTDGAITATFHPLFTHLDDGLRQLRKIMDENTAERELLGAVREKLLAETASQQEQITSLTATVASQAEKIGSLQSALSVLMAQCDQQLHAIRSALGQS